jgi:hypothetical protein
VRVARFLDIPAIFWPSQFRATLQVTVVMVAASFLETTFGERLRRAE